jgi:hypothetical protein
MEINLAASARAKNLLGLDGEHSIFELTNLLRQFRNESHPDLFQDIELKEKAETRFKEAGSLLSELERLVEQDRLSRNVTELIAYKPLYEVAKLNSERDLLLDELKATKYELAQQSSENERLKSKVDEKNDASLKDEIEYVRSLYRPSSKRFASFGLAILLTGALGTMTQMERVSAMLQKYSPVGTYVISTTLFVFFLLLIAVVLRQLWESEYMRKKSGEVCSPRYAADFEAFLSRKHFRIGDQEPLPDFSEMEVFEFLSGPETKTKKAMRLLGFTIFRPEAIDRLKDVFLHNLLNKRLIEPGRASTMQRYFRVISSRPYHEWYHEYMTKRKQSKVQSESPTN